MCGNPVSASVQNRSSIADLPSEIYCNEPCGTTVDCFTLLPSALFPQCPKGERTGEALHRDAVFSFPPQYGMSLSALAVKVLFGVIAQPDFRLLDRAYNAC